MININEIVYFNLFGNGDLHYSREFVKYFLSKIPIKSQYVHAKCPFLLRDIQVEYSHVLRTNQKNANQIGFFVEGETLFLGTWIGQQAGKWCNDTGCCTIKNNYRMYSEFAQMLNIPMLDEFHYIPTIDFSKYSVDQIDINLDKNILISNGMCLSGQALNFNMNPLIISLAKKYSGCNFYVTHPFQTDLKNIIDCNSLINDNLKSNLNEISYISTFCDIIVGRGSGPFCFTHIKQNLNNKNKTFISTGNIETEINWVTMSDYGLTEHAKQLWVGSSNNTPNLLYALIDEEINAKFGNR